MSSTANIMLYSDDRSVRDALKLALGRTLAGRNIEILERATQQAVMDTLDVGGVDLVIADGEAVPAGGMGVARQIKDEITDPPPVLLIVARQADYWLATWSRAEGVVTFPIDPIAVAAAAAKLLEEAA